MFILHGATTQRVFFAHPLRSGLSASPGNQKAPRRVQLLATSVRPAAIIMCWYQRWDRIRITGVDSGRILRFSFGPGSGTGVKNLGKTGPGIGVTFLSFGRSSSLFGNFLSKNMDKLRLDWWLQPESEQVSDSQIWRIAGPGSGRGFQNFRTGAESESEKVTPATSGWYQTKYKIDIKTRQKPQYDTIHSLEAFSFPTITLSCICFLSITFFIFRAKVNFFQYSVHSA